MEEARNQQDSSAAIAPERTAREDPAYASYLSTHHGHVGPAANHPLTEIEFRANFLAYLPPPPARILELGCGTGASLERLAALGYHQLAGWDISEEGFRVVLSAEVPDVVRRHLREDVDAFLADHGLTREDIVSWVSHPGGPRVLEAMQESLELPDGALELAWRSLREVGNLSSTSALLVLEQTMSDSPPAPGSFGMMLAMGPGFCSELVLLRW